MSMSSTGNEASMLARSRKAGSQGMQLRECHGTILEDKARLEQKYIGPNTLAARSKSVHSNGEITTIVTASAGTTEAKRSQANGRGGVTEW